MCKTNKKFTTLVFTSSGLILCLLLWGGPIVQARYRTFNPAYATDQDKDTPLIQNFLSEQNPSKRYKDLFLYFVKGASRRATPDSTRIHYIGAASSHGQDVDGIEGYARTGSLFAAWLYSGRPSKTGSIDLVAFLKHGLLSGTDPSDKAYWGDLKDHDQRTIEAADIARIIWMTRKQIWDHLTQSEKETIVRWLDKANTVTTFDNNWALAPITIDVLMTNLGARMSDDGRGRWKTYKQRFYAGNGWFIDKPHGIDYYNAWSISYEMFWITFVDPDFDQAFIHKALQESAFLTSHLISPKGLPIMGRSQCYRMAIPVPLVANALLSQNARASGLARHSLDRVWEHFLKHGGVKDGVATQGYYEPDLRLLDRYSGPASCQWSLRALTLAFLSNDQAPFWQAQESPLPVEQEDFDLNFPAIGWRLIGEKETGNIIIEIDKNKESPNYERRSHAYWRQLAETILQRPMRPDNFAEKYGEWHYSVINSQN